MSLPTWTPDALRSEPARNKTRAWRLVEAQHRVATMKLVDGAAEQAVLEDILEATKPPVPTECKSLHYLLATPFRYGSYPSGSRFRRAGRTPGVWYGAERIDTAVAEMVFYRFLFFAEAPDVPWPVAPAEYTAIQAEVAGEMIDLTEPPFSKTESAWMDPTGYGACQALADAARGAGVEVIRYASVRDPGKGANLAVLTCLAFARKAPVRRQTWRIRLGAFGAFAISDAGERRLEFPRDSFRDPRLDGMSWTRP